jgi:hypothetical protein
VQAERRHRVTLVKEGKGAPCAAGNPLRFPSAPSGTHYSYDIPSDPFLAPSTSPERQTSQLHNQVIVPRSELRKISMSRRC